MSDPLSRWLVAVGRADEVVFATVGDVTGPGVPDVGGPWTAGELVENGEDIATALTTHTEGLDEAERDVLVHRILGNETLRQVAQRVDASHEYVRQVDQRVRASFQELLGSPRFHDLVQGVAKLPLTPVEDLAGEAPALGGKVADLSRTALEVLAALDGGYEVHSGFYVPGDLRAAKQQTVDLLETLSDDLQAAPLDELQEAFGFERPVLDAWLALIGVETMEGFALAPATNIADQAAAALYISGEPLRVEELLEKLPRKRSIRSLRNRLGVDERFVRVDVDAWGLAAWGEETYAGIRSAIGERVDALGGRVPVEDLVRSLTEQFSVAKTSVLSYAASPPYETRGGFVTRRTGQVEADTDPHSTSSLYRTSDGWVYRAPVVAAHFRGIGGSLPMGVAAALNLKFGERQEFTSLLGPQHVYWTGLQPTLGTVRRFVKDLDEGDQIFLHFGDDGTFNVTEVPEPSDDPLADALNLIGAGDSVGDPLTLFSQALSYPGQLSPTAVERALSARGDEDVARLVREAYFSVPATTTKPESPHEQPTLF